MVAERSHISRRFCDLITVNSMSYCCRQKVELAAIPGPWRRIRLTVRKALLSSRLRVKTLTTLEQTFRPFAPGKAIRESERLLSLATLWKSVLKALPRDLRGTFWCITQCMQNRSAPLEQRRKPLYKVAVTEVYGYPGILWPTVWSQATSQRSDDIIGAV